MIQVKIGSHTISMTDLEVKIAKQMVVDFMETVQKTSKEQGYPMLYFTAIIMMHLVSKEQIVALMPEAAKKSGYSYYQRFET